MVLSDDALVFCSSVLEYVCLEVLEAAWDLVSEDMRVPNAQGGSANAANSEERYVNFGRIQLSHVGVVLHDDEQFSELYANLSNLGSSLLASNQLTQFAFTLPLEDAMVTVLMNSHTFPEGARLHDDAAKEISQFLNFIFGGLMARKRIDDNGNGSAALDEISVLRKVVLGLFPDEIGTLAVELGQERLEVGHARTPSVPHRL
jgi:hypothetical protein